MFKIICDRNSREKRKNEEEMLFTNAGAEALPLTVQKTVIFRVETHTESQERK